MSINRVVVGGRLTKDPELRYTPTGVAVCTFTLACDRNFKNASGGRDTDFLPIVVYRQLAELSANALSKGKKTTIDGRIQVRSYTGNDGQKHWVTEIIAETVDFPPRDNQNEGNYQQSQGNYPQQGNHQSNDQSHNDQGGNTGWGDQVPFNEDDIPFT